MIKKWSATNKVAQKKHKGRHDWLERWSTGNCAVNYIDQSYIHGQETVLENEIYKIKWDFEIKVNHPIQAIKLDIVIVNNKEKNLWTLLFQHIEILTEMEGNIEISTEWNESKAKD